MLHQIERYKSIQEKYQEMTKEKNLTSNLKILSFNMKLDNISYKDQFEWDLNKETNSPEAFSRSLCMDLGFPREWEVALSCSIREEILNQKQKCVDSFEYAAKRQIEWNGEVCRFQQDEICWGPQVVIKKKEEPIRRAKRINEQVEPEPEQTPTSSSTRSAKSKKYKKTRSPKD